MVEKRRGLGRGLGALISGSPSNEEESPSQVDTGPSAPSEETTTRTDATKTSPDSKSLTSRAPQSADRVKATTKKPSIPAASPVSRETSSGKAKKTPPKATSVSAEKPVPSDDSDSTKKSASKDSNDAVTQKTGSAERTKTKSGSSESPRKSRPVDMFFTPGRVEEEAAGQPQSADTADRKSPTTRNRRVAVPDVLGKVRGPREETEGAEGKNTVPESVAPQGDQPLKRVEESQSVAQGSTSVQADDGVSRETLVAVPGATFAEVAVGSIHPNRKQPRTVFDDEDMAELVHSIREVGLLQPIVLRPSDEGGAQQYELVMGERRWRAVQDAGLSTIPAIVRETADTALLRDALLENLHRSQLNPLEEAAAYQQLMQEFDCTQDELSERIGRSRPQISNTIRLMRLPALVQRRVAAGVLSAGHARALLGLEDVADMERLAQRIVNEGLSVRATEEIVSMNDGLRRTSKEKSPRSTARHERLDYLANSLSDHLETNVKISLGAKKGRVSIEFGSVDDLNRIMGVIAPSAEQ